MVVLFFLILSTLGLALFFFAKDPRVSELGKLMIFCSVLAICIRLEGCDSVEALKLRGVGG